jgi:hypothetical protein
VLGKLKKREAITYKVKFMWRHGEILAFSD